MNWHGRREGPAKKLGQLPHKLCRWGLMFGQEQILGLETLVCVAHVYCTVPLPTSHGCGKQHHAMWSAGSFQPDVGAMPALNNSADTVCGLVHGAQAPSWGRLVGTQEARVEIRLKFQNSVHTVLKRLHRTWHCNGHRSRSGTWDNPPNRSWTPSRVGNGGGGRSNHFSMRREVGARWTDTFLVGMVGAVMK